MCFLSGALLLATSSQAGKNEKHLLQFCAGLAIIGTVVVVCAILGVKDPIQEAEED